MSQSKHAETPYYAEEGEHNIMIRANDQVAIGMPGNSKKKVLKSGVTVAYLSKVSSRPTEQVRQSAAFIVRACNSHYEMLNALERMIAIYDSGAWSRHNIADARAAIAKAKGPLP